MGIAVLWDHHEFCNFSFFEESSFYYIRRREPHKEIQSPWTRCQKCEHRGWGRNQVVQLVLLVDTEEWVVMRWGRPINMDLHHHTERHRH